MESMVTCPVAGPTRPRIIDWARRRPGTNLASSSDPRSSTAEGSRSDGRGRVRGPTPDCPVAPSPRASTQEVVDELRRAGATGWASLLFPLAPGEAHELHRFNAELAERCPGMVPFGGVLATDTDPLGIVQEAVEGWGMAGLKFHPMVQRFSPAEPVLEPVVRYLEERSRAV